MRNRTKETSLNEILSRRVSPRNINKTRERDVKRSATATVAFHLLEVSFIKLISHAKA